MDPQVLAVLTGLIANALTQFANKCGQKVLQDLSPDGADQSLSGMLKHALNEASEAFEWSGPGRLEEVCIFLATPEAELAVREVFATNLASPSQQPDDLKSAKDNFVRSLALFLEEKAAEVRGPGEKLFEQIVETCQFVLSKAVDEGILAAIDANEAFRHQLVMDELKAIGRRLEFLKASKVKSVKAYLEFEAKYRKQVKCRHENISPPHFDGTRRIPIEKMYVQPSFEFMYKNSRNEAVGERITTSELIASSHRCVVLGNPGGGKSTFASYVCHQLASNYGDRLFCGRELTPIHVVLREYGVAKRDLGYSLLDFIESNANSKYQVKAPAGAFEYLLLSGRVLLVLDGLDELLDTSYRKEVTGDVESFCNLFPEVPVLVTSRQVGYKQAPLDPARFETIKLAALSDSQIQQFVRKWFASLDGGDEEQHAAFATKFFEESNVVRDLCSNPLMLSLICSIYRGERYIPRNRPDVYEKCAVMLFERWDKSRGIKVALPFEAHLRPAMMHLANWIYRDQELQNGVTENRLIKSATSYLSQKRFEDEDEARQAAVEFIEFCTGRAWVFTDTGTTEHGERLFQFTHRTFLEYFAAAYLVRTHETPAKLAKLLCPKIALGEWDVVAQLAFQIQNKNIEGAGDKLLTSVVKRARERKRNKWPLLEFAARCLEFIVPSPAVLREIIEEGIQEWVIGESGDVNAGQSFCACLGKAATENETLLVRSVEDSLSKRICDEDFEVSCRAIEIALNLELLVFDYSRPRVDYSEIKKSEWASSGERILSLHGSRISKIAQSDFGMSMMMYFHCEKSLKQIVENFGLDSIFTRYKPRAFSEFTFFSPLQSVVYPAIENRSLSENQKDQRTRATAELSEMLLEKEPPWFSVKARDTPTDIIEYLGFKQDIEDDIEPIYGDAAFVAIVGVASETEIGGSQAKAAVSSFRGSVNPNILKVVNAVLPRLEAISEEAAQASIECLKMSSEQQGIVIQWVKREIDFCILK